MLPVKDDCYADSCPEHNCTIWGNVTGQRLCERGICRPDDCTIWGNVTGQRPTARESSSRANCTIWGNVTGQRPFAYCSRRCIDCTIWGNVTGQRQRVHRGHGQAHCTIWGNVTDRYPFDAPCLSIRHLRVAELDGGSHFGIIAKSFNQDISGSECVAAQFVITGHVYKAFVGDDEGARSLR